MILGYFTTVRPDCNNPMSRRSGSRLLEGAKGIAANAVDEQTAHLVLDDAVVLAIALAEEVLEGADSLLLLALRQLVDVLAAVLPVRRLDEDRDERPLEVTGVAMAEGDGGVGPAAGLLAESGVEVLEELPGGHGFGGAERTVGESIRFVVHVLGGQLVVNLALVVGLFLDLAGLGHLHVQDGCAIAVAVGFALAQPEVGPALVELDLAGVAAFAAAGVVAALVGDAAAMAAAAAAAAAGIFEEGPDFVGGADEPEQVGCCQGHHRLRCIDVGGGCIGGGGGGGGGQGRDYEGGESCAEVHFGWRAERRC